jgi:two-component sensor histidine kinase
MAYIRNLISPNYFLAVFLLYFELVCFNALADNDSLLLNKFYSFKTNEEKINWLYKSKDFDVTKFILKNKTQFDSLSINISSVDNQRTKYELLFIDGLLSTNQNKYQKAIPIFLNILCQKEFVSQKDSMRAIAFLKNCFSNTLNYTKAFEMQLLLDKLIKRNPILIEEDQGLPLSIIYMRMGLTHESIKYLKEEYKQSAKRNDDKYAEINFYNNLGVFFNKANEPDSAIFYFEKAQIIINKLLSNEPMNSFYLFFEGLIEGNKGQALMAKKQFKQAIPLLKKDIKSSIQFKDFQNACISYNELAKCYFECKLYKECEAYLDSANNILQEIDAPLELLRNLKLKAQLWSLNGRFKEAIEVYQQFNNMQDSIALNEKELQMLNQRIAYQTVKLQEKIDLQEKEIDAKQIIEEKRNLQRILMFIFILILLFLLSLGYYLFKRSKKRESVLFEKNEEIVLKSSMLRNALTEKELLMKEVHHRVKNNMQIIMSLLKLQSDKINDKQVEVYFSEARNRIQSMALIHEFLYKKEKMDYMQMDDYIKQLILEIQNSYTQPNHIIEIHTDLDPIQLDFDTSIPLGLIINELVTNSYKHAFPNGVGNIWVSFKKEASSYILIIKDNGIGLPENFKEKMENSLGMELIHLLSDQINAQIEIKQQRGFEAKISFTV